LSNFADEGFDRSVEGFRIRLRDEIVRRAREDMAAMRQVTP
jgi:hypothetical protein